VNKAQEKAREENIRELQPAYPGLKDAAKLQDRLYSLALQAGRNAAMLCSDSATWVDQRPQLRAKVAALAARHGISLDFELSGDPRGFALKLRLPTGRSNSFAGEVWGIA
jgi:hypothetical protein